MYANKYPNNKHVHMSRIEGGCADKIVACQFFEARRKKTTLP